MKYCLLPTTATLVVSAVVAANAQAPSCADIAGKYSGFFKGTTKVLFELEPSCKLTLSTNAGAAVSEATMKNGHLVAKSTSWDFDLTPKDGKLVGIFNYGTTSDKNISFSKS